MDIEKIVAEIDAEIETRSPGVFGIRMGDTVYRALFHSGHVTIEKFGFLGTGAGAVAWPTYKMQYGVYMDPDMPEEAFEVGVPG